MSLDKLYQQMGYTARAVEDLSNRVGDFEEDLRRHMKDEEAERKVLDKKLTFLGALMLIAVAKDINWDAVIAFIL